MVAVGMLMAWAGYAAAGWGYVLVRGWNIPWSAWVNPLHPYEWPKAGTPGPIPDGQLTPNPASAQSGGGGQGGTPRPRPRPKAPGGGGGGVHPRA